MPNLELLKKINLHILCVISGVVLLTLIVINLIGTNVLATKGFALSNTEEQILLLEKQNRELSIRIEDSTKLQSLEAKATGMGYVRINEIVAVPTIPTFALK